MSIFLDDRNSLLKRNKEIDLAVLEEEKDEDSTPRHRGKNLSDIRNF